MTSTLVSSLLYIESPFLHRRHRDIYRPTVERLMSLNTPMFMQVDEHYREHVYRSRIKYDPAFHRTKLRTVEFADLDVYKYYPRLKELAKISSVARGPVWASPHYVMTIWNKLWLLESVAKENPFQTQWFVWIDAGGIRHPIAPGLQWPGREDVLDDGKLNVFCLSKPQKLSRNAWNAHARNFGTFSLAICIIGKPAAIARAKQLFEKVARECLDSNIIASEQAVIDFCQGIQPELFHFIDATHTPSRTGNPNSSQHWYYKHNFFDHLLA